MTTPNVGVRVFGLSDVGKLRQKNEDAFVVVDLMQPLPIHAMQAEFVNANETAIS